MSNDPMRDFMRKQRQTEDKAWKGFWNPPRSPTQKQRIARSNYEPNNNKQYAPQTEIHHTKVHHYNIYDPEINSQGDREIYLIDSGMNWGMFKLFIIFIAALIFFGILMLSGTPHPPQPPNPNPTPTQASEWQPAITSQTPITDFGGTLWNVQIPVVKMENSYISLSGQGTVNQLPWLRAIAYTNVQSKSTTNIDFMLTDQYTVAFIGLTAGEMPRNSEMTTLGFFNITSGKDVSNISLASCGTQKSYRIPAILLNTWYSLSITQNQTNKTATIKIFNPVNSDRIFGPIDVDTTNCPSFDRFNIGTRGMAKTLFSNYITQ